MPPTLYISLDHCYQVGSFNVWNISIGENVGPIKIVKQICEAINDVA